VPIRVTHQDAKLAGSLGQELARDLSRVG